MRCNELSWSKNDFDSVTNLLISMQWKTFLQSFFLRFLVVVVFQVDHIVPSVRKIVASEEKFHDITR